MLSYQIIEMRRHGDGFCVATVKSFRDQEEYTLHDRYGSWMSGPPDAKDVTMREAATIDRDLAFGLQEYKRKHKIELARPSSNGHKKPNPFIVAAAKKNPFIAKALREGKIS